VTGGTGAGWPSRTTRATTCTQAPLGMTRWRRLSTCAPSAATAAPAELAPLDREGPDAPLNLIHAGQRSASCNERLGTKIAARRFSQLAPVILRFDALAGYIEQPERGECIEHLKRQREVRHRGLGREVGARQTRGHDDGLTRADATQT
jgi:hypothetical protein